MLRTLAADCLFPADLSFQQLMLQFLDFDVVLKNEVKKLLLDAQQSGNDELNSGRYIFEVQHAKLVVQICMSEKITGKLSLEF